MDVKNSPNFIVARALGFFKPKPRSMSTRNRGTNKAKTAVKQASKAAPRINTDKPGPYQAASLHCNGSASACEAAKNVEGYRFLAREIAIIPLRDCTSSECRCSYKRFKDRRIKGRERRAIGSVRANFSGAQSASNQRQAKGRRNEDDKPFSSF